MNKRLTALLMCVILILSCATAASGLNAFDAFSGYSITREMMDPQLRLVGSLYRLFMPNFSPGIYRLSNFFLDNFVARIDLTNRDINREVIYVDRADGTRLRLCVYSPKVRRGDVPGLLWIHGGGYAMGVPEQDYKFINDFVEASGCVVVAPDYINSTDAPYPAALNDCYRALLWLRDNAARYGMSPDRIFVGGNSAGGGLTAAVSMYARDMGEVSIAFQMPLFPMLDDRMITESSRNNDGPVWNTQSNELAWKLYLGEAYGSGNVSKYAAPARETDYSGLPPTLTFVGDIDPFADETVQYVENLRAAGVEVSFKMYEGCFHAFTLFGFADAAKDATAFLLDGFMYAVENYSKPQPEKEV